MPNRFPSQLEEKAVERGADELVALAEFHFRDRPRALRNIRNAYKRFCAWLYRKLERSYRSQGGGAK
jgi:hypothetical protein